MTGDNVTEIEELLAKVQELLGVSSVKYYTCSDRTTSHKKIVIEYGHGDNND